jgi:hydrogenase maturation protein HypF
VLTASTAREALSLEVVGVVQGVGFRPFVYRLAQRHGLDGWVRNDAGQVHITVEGSPDHLREFVNDLQTQAPPLARIDAVHTAAAQPSSRDTFTIVESGAPDRAQRQPICPDVGICPACEAELFDPANRRYRYPFITCTDCGPRFTVIEDMPYDRERTSMRVFTQCAACRAEYESPSDRRHHSETNSCPDCGPRLTLLIQRPDSPPDRIDARALETAAALLADGRILAVRGLGGFHLAVDATDELAVERLRQRKHREAKPLAVMVRTLPDARRLGRVRRADELLLAAPERPVVVLELHTNARLAPSVAPGLNSVGVMVAYTPLHHLLLDLVDRPLVMTSANLSDEQIAISNEDAVARLSGVADAFLMHDRDIVSRYDDSVIRTIDDMPIFLRRARGYAPLPLPLPVASPTPLVAVGPHLKNTFTLVQDRTAYVSQHIGDLDNIKAVEHFTGTLQDYRRLFRIDPAVAVRDCHPGYLSTRLAEELGLPRVLSVQHHHAHVAAVAAEHGLTERVVGVAYDGTGYGDDGKIWGAEILVADLVGYTRAARMRYVPLPGGDLAVRRPWRAALGFLSLDPETAWAFTRAFEDVNPLELALARQQIARDLNAPAASSMGRLFDAAAAVLGLRTVAQYEGQAAMELEALAGSRTAGPLPFSVAETHAGLQIFDPLPLLVALGHGAHIGANRAYLAAQFHETVALATSLMVRNVCENTGIGTVVLGGGVFQNARLLATTARQLDAVKLRVLTPRALGPNDGAVSYGQAAVAAATLQEGAG